MGLQQRSYDALPVSFRYCFRAFKSSKISNMKQPSSHIKRVMSTQKFKVLDRKTTIALIFSCIFETLPTKKFFAP